jgi:hypothetical protein
MSRPSLTIYFGQRELISFNKRNCGEHSVFLWSHSASILNVTYTSCESH